MSLKLFLDEPDQILSQWPAEPLRAHRSPAEFAHLLTMAEVDGLIDTDCLALPNLALLKDGKILDRALYADPGADRPRRGAVREHLAAGGTLSLRQLDRLRPAIARLRQALHTDTGYPTHINGYLTPPGNQGLKYHYDPYLTLIVQLSGRKRWPLHRPFLAHPVVEYGGFRRRGFTAEQQHFLAHTPPVSDFTLEPGDILWLPRGWVHSPYTEGGEPSLHLTIGITERTHHWVATTLVGDVLAHALADPAMRAAVPPEQILADPAATVRDARKYLLACLMTMDEAAACELIRVSARGES